jgi:phage terminase large subunit-like protein
LLKEYTAQDTLHHWERYQCCRLSLEGLQWIQISDWRTTNEVIEKPPPGTPVYCAIDFSKSFDITSMAYGYWLNGKVNVRWHHWVVKDQHVKSVKRDYQRFVDNWDHHDNVTICPHTIQYDSVKAKLEELKGWGDLRRIGFDAFGGMSTEIQKWGSLEDSYNPDTDLPMWPLPQTIMSMGPSTYLLESLIRHKSIAMEQDDIVEYALANVQLEKNINGDRRPSKLRSMGIIDPVVACVMLCGVLIKEGAERPGAYFDAGDIAC